MTKSGGGGNAQAALVESGRHKPWRQLKSGAREFLAATLDAKYAPNTTTQYIKSGAYCFTSFFVCGSVPLIGYVAFMPLTSNPQTLFAILCILTACALFMLGALKSHFTLGTRGTAPDSRCSSSAADVRPRRT